MALEAKALLFDAAQPHLGRDFLGLGPAVHAREGVVVVSQLPSLHHRRMTLGAVFRALDFGGIGPVGSFGGGNGHLPAGEQRRGQDPLKQFAHSAHKFWLYRIVRRLRESINKINKLGFQNQV